MAELGFGMLLDVGFNLVPIALVVADPLAGSADGQHAAQCFDFRQRLHVIDNELLLFLFQLFPLGDVPKRGHRAAFFNNIFPLGKRVEKFPLKQSSLKIKNT